MKVSRRWIEWAHGPRAEDGQPLAMSLCDLVRAPGVGSIEVADPTLIAELVDVAELYVNPCRGRGPKGTGLHLARRKLRFRHIQATFPEGGAAQARAPVAVAARGFG